MCRNPLVEGELPLNALTIEQYGYSALLKGLFDVVVARRFDKQRAVWVQGLANTGKSIILRMLDEIFICDTLEDG